jgi:oligopeptide/dipeptide ABC transporter ATP-binding protein
MGRRDVVRAVDGVSLEVGRGEILGLVGESGSGKTTLGRAVLRLIEPTGGTVRFDGRPMEGLARTELRQLRRRMQIVFQDPYTALSPRMQIRQIVAEPLRFHGLVERPDEEERVAELLGRVGLESYMMDRYPHEMSGGQRQRIAIARALALEPDFLVADEPVSALDVSVRAQVLSIMLRLRDELGISILFISHDLGVVRRVADRVAVMYGERIMETGDTRRVMSAPQHPYTRALLSAVPSHVPGARRERIVLREATPDDRVDTTGCPFAIRCPQADAACRATVPALEALGPGHRVACLQIPEE